MNTSTLTRPHRSGRLSIDGVAARVVRRAFARIGHGRLDVRTGSDSRSYGDEDSDLHARVVVHDDRLFGAALAHGSAGIGRAYARGWWTTDDLPAVIALFARNDAALSSLTPIARWVGDPIRRIAAWRRRNSRSGSRRNVRSHYDLGNAFFELFLDPTMTYSCALFETPEATLEAASIAKLDRVCETLAIGSSDHVLEIGSGWGSFAIHAARTRGCRVTTTTISREQHAVARRRVAEAGLSDRVDVRLDDYRDLRGRYDKLVSIEMIEAVGARHLDAYIGTCSSLLRPHGAMLLQAILIRDHLYARALSSIDFIKSEIFPGTFMPSLTAITRSMSRVSDLVVSDLFEMTAHYAETLARWRRALLANAERVVALGFDETFVRLWEFYLAYCEAGFRERRIGDAQILLTKPSWGPS